MNHDLKIEDKYLEDIKSGIKTFEYRKNDRNYKVGDTLTFRCGTDDEIKVRVTYILEGVFNIPAGYAILGIELIEEN